MENVVKYLKAKWNKLTAFNKNEDLKDRLWSEITELHSRRNRHYHNLSHLGNMFHLLDQHLEHVENPALIGFAIFYHDIEYDTLRKDNEEQSVIKCREHLHELKVKSSLIEDVVSLILATKEHKADPYFSNQKDMALFLDLDLAVLAEEWNDYQLYRESIRKEFGQYAEATFRNGRKNALEQLLNKDVIFYSPDFHNSLEEKARQNLEREISLL